MQHLLLVFLLAEVVVSDVLQVYQKSNLLFTNDVYQTFSQKVKDSFAFSPSSLQAALAVLVFGGQKETKTELIQVAHFPHNTSEIVEIYGKLEKHLSATNSSLLNYLYLYTSNITLNSPYEVFVRNVFKVNITKQTFSLHEQALADSIVILSNRIAIVHRLILTARWKPKFDKTHTLSFHMPDGEINTIDTISTKQVLNYYYNKVLQAQFLEIPFTDSELTFTIVLPDKVDGLPMVEKYVFDVLPAQPYQKLNISVTIPKRWGAYMYNPISSLRSLGLTTPFSDNATFTGISDTPSKVIKFMQGTYIDLQNGSNVLGIDYVEDDLTDRPETKFIADHPFIYYIKHRVMGVVLIGRYVKPILSY